MYLENVYLFLWFLMTYYLGINILVTKFLFLYSYFIKKPPKVSLFQSLLVSLSIYLSGWTTLTPFCQLHLRPAVLPTPLSEWLSFSLLTRTVPKPDKFSINFYLCLHLIRKLEECLLLMQMVNGHETPRGRKNPQFPETWTCFFLVVRFYF